MPGRVFVAMLRQPRRNDSRDDPFWEFGSFGCTGCHGNNLLHPARCQIADGDRLAFVQGGWRGARLLLVTPAVSRLVHDHGGKPHRIEVRWDQTAKPFRYGKAPGLLATDLPGQSQLFPILARFIAGAKRPTVDAKLASRFRARAKPLEAEIAAEVVAGFESAVACATTTDFIESYEQAFPWINPAAIVQDRQRRFSELQAKLTNGGELAPQS